MPRALKVCSCTGCAAHDGGCPELAATGRCAGCQAVAEALRGTASARGYGHRHERRFRRGVLRRDPLCVCPRADHVWHPAGQCLAPSSHADHYPYDRRELLRRGLDANDPARGRGLCARCHNAETARLQPGGWNAR